MRLFLPVQYCMLHIAAQQSIWNLYQQNANKLRFAQLTSTPKQSDFLCQQQPQATRIERETVSIKWDTFVLKIL